MKENKRRKRMKKQFESELNEWESYKQNHLKEIELNTSQLEKSKKQIEELKDILDFNLRGKEIKIKGLIPKNPQFKFEELPEWHYYLKEQLGRDYKKAEERIKEEIERLESQIKRIPELNEESRKKVQECEDKLNHLKKNV